MPPASMGGFFSQQQQNSMSMMPPGGQMPPMFTGHMGAGSQMGGVPPGMPPNMPHMPFQPMPSSMNPPLPMGTMPGKINLSKQGIKSIHKSMRKKPDDITQCRN